MIKFNKNFKDEWKNKIVFAPNAFGKTQSSLKLLELLNSVNKENALLFTRKQLDNLVCFNKKTFYFGNSAKSRERISKIENTLSNKKILTSFIKQHYDVTSAANLKKQSYFFKKKGISNLSGIYYEELEKRCSDVNDIDNDSAFKLDRLLSDCQLNKITHILENKENIQDDELHQKEITIDLFDKLNDIYDSLSFEGIECPLCGTKFNSNNELKARISENLKLYHITDQLYNDLIFVFNQIVLLYKNKDFESFRYLFNGIDFESKTTLEDKIYTLTVFKNILDALENKINYLLSEIQVGDSTIGELYYEKAKNLKHIEEIDELENNKDEVLDFILDEFKKITCESAPSYSIEKDISNLAFVINGENIKEFTKPSEILSESEQKRLALAVIKAKLKYGPYKYLILDDPLDSYDDYYLSIVCDYIADVVNIKKLEGYYLLTNNTQALFELTRSLGTESIVFYESPDILINDEISILSMNVSKKQIEEVFSSELVLVKEYIKSETKFDDEELLLLALIPTIRNIYSEIIHKFSNIDFKTQKRKLVRLINELDNSYIHYSYKENNDIDMKQLIDCYDGYGKIARDVECINRSILLARKEIYEKPFADFKNANKLLTLILKKALATSYLRYDFEKRLICELKNSFNFSDEEITTICNEKGGISNKIDKAIEISESRDGQLNAFLSKAHSIQSKYGVIGNDYAHSLTRMLPPFISTRIYDIYRYKKEIDQLFSCFDR